MRTDLVHIAIVLVLTGSLHGCQPAPDASVKPTQSQLPQASLPIVDTVHVRMTRADRAYQCEGILRVIRPQKISSLVEGTISEFPHSSGTYLRRGQRIARIDTTFLSLTHRENRAALRKASIDFESLRARRGMVDSLPEEAIQRWEYEAGLPAARLALRRSALRLKHTVIVAPSDGWLGKLHVMDGEQIMPGQQIADFIPAHSMEAELYMAPNTSFLPESGTKTELRVQGISVPLAGTVRGVNPQVNKQGLVVVYVSLPHVSQHLVAGTQVRATFRHLNEEPVLTVPESAVLRRGGRDMVFRFQDGQAEWTYVEAGIRDDLGVRIHEGLSPGDPVLVSGNTQLAHGEKVYAARKTP